MGKRNTTKSAAKRFRITKTGKIIRRPMSVNHFRTRKSTRNLRNKRKTLSIDQPRKNITGY